MLSLKYSYLSPLIAISFLLLFLISALFAPWIAPYNPYLGNITERLCSPSSKHWLGCDLYGTDLLSSLIYGSRISLSIAAICVFVSTLLGTVIGLLSGYLGGWTDFICMRLVDVFMAFPGILLAMLLTSVMGPSYITLIIALSVLGWTGSTRLVRGQILSLKSRDYVIYSASLKASRFHILYHHLLPAVATSLVVHATFSVSGIIIIESGLSFLGLAPQTGLSSWGALLTQGSKVLGKAPLLSLAPGLCIMSLVLALNFLGDYLRDALDPKKKL